MALAAVALGALSSCSFFQRSTAQRSIEQPRPLSKAAVPRVAGAPSWLPSQGQADGFLPAEVDLAVKAAAATLPLDKHGRPTYPSESVRHRFVRTTSYSHQENEAGGAYGRLNAMGTVLKYGRVRSAAADWSRYPVGTVFRIKGLPHVYVVDDYGSSLAGTNTIDIYHPNLRLMRKWATRDAEIHVIRWGSWEQAANLLRGRTQHQHCALMYYATLAKIRRQRVAFGEKRGTPSL